jgi:hypothetical protein
MGGNAGPTIEIIYCRFPEKYNDKGLLPILKV